MDEFKKIVFGVCAIVAAATLACSAIIDFYSRPYEQSVDQTIPNAYTEGTWNHELAEGACL